jgi:hypothetical protein
MPVIVNAGSGQAERSSGAIRKSQQDMDDRQLQRVAGARSARAVP